MVRVVICASDAGAAVGWSPYVTPAEVAAKILGRVNKDAVVRLADRAVSSAATGVAAEDVRRHICHEAAKIVEATAPVVTATVTTTPVTTTPVATPPVTTAPVATAFTPPAPALVAPVTIAPTPSAPVTLVSTPEIQAAITAMAFTEIGRRDEPVALDLYERQFGDACIPGGAWLMKELACSGNYVGGRVDATHADGNAVVEIKCRQKHFFARIPPREKAQLYVYMYITGARLGYWCQLFDGEVKREAVPWDDAFWDDFQSRLIAFGVQVAAGAFL